MNAIFTICAKNYLAQAKTLGYSIKKHAPDVDFFILLSDEIGSDDIKCDGFTVLESKNLDIFNYHNLAFKYDVIEFSTAVKPYFIDILFKQKGYDKILYIDPDMVVYDSLEFLFDTLETHDAILTPHLLKPYKIFTGATSEEELLFVGIYNLGFFAVNNSATGRQIIDWWKERLKDQCYADKEDGLHVDQKWMDFLPSLYGDRIKILRHPGVNLAFWNMHERQFLDDGKTYKVDDQKLVIFHFSGLDADKPNEIARKQTKFSLQTLPEYQRLFHEYVSELANNDLAYLSTLKYTHNFFDNGIFILKYQRRLFRALKTNVYLNPFSTEKSSYFELLVKNKLMIHDKAGQLHALRKSQNVDSKVGILIKLMLNFKRIVGIKKYYLLMRFLEKYYRFEKQLFLIETNE